MTKIMIATEKCNNIKEKIRKAKKYLAELEEELMECEGRSSDYDEDDDDEPRSRRKYREPEYRDDYDIRMSRERRSRY